MVLTDATALDPHAREASQALRWSPAWVIEPAGAPPAGSTELVLSAGADRRVAIDGLDPRTRAAAQRWQAGEPAVAHDRAQHLLRDRLVALGALTPALPSAAAVTLIGDPAVTGELAELMGPGMAPHDLTVAVRTGAAWPSIPDGRVHMGLDVALHHTIVLGPLVLPGASACLGCLDARLAQQWPAAPVPSRPAVQRCLAVAAALLRVQVDLVAGGASPLVNATIAWDLECGTTDRQALYKQPGCTRCDTGGASGRVALPWESAWEPVWEPASEASP
jgi:hypothetical protein